MSLKKNIIANYSSQILIVVMSLVTLPRLITIMGSEAYGLVGFFSLMQSWLMLLDLGMSPTLTREIARYKGGVLDAYNLLNFFNTIKKIFIGIAIAITISTLLCSDYIATSWLKTELIAHDVLIKSIMLMAFILAFRWVSSVYRAAVVGFEKLVWFGIFNTVFAVLRFVVVFVILLFIDQTPISFFTYQLVISALELLILIIYVKRLLPSKIEAITQNIRPLKDLMGFSLTIAFTGAVWIVITQTDKLILSKLLSLSDYGFYSIAVQVAGAITLISGPISSAILPRMAKLEAEGKHFELIELYRSSTRLIVIIAGTVALILIFFTKKVIFMWTGDAMMVEKISPFAYLYSIGNFLLAIAAFPYYLQYAKGNLKFHLYGNIAFVLFLIPSLIIVVNKYGGIGAGYVWIAVNTLYLFVWVPIINNYFVKGLNRKWYLNDIFKISVPACIVAYLLSCLMPATTNRIYSFLELCFVGAIILLSCLLMSGELKKMRRKFHLS